MTDGLNLWKRGVARGKYNLKELKQDGKTDEKVQRSSASTMSQLRSLVGFSPVPEYELIKYAITLVSERQL